MKPIAAHNLRQIILEETRREIQRNINADLAELRNILHGPSPNKNDVGAIVVKYLGFDELQMFVDYIEASHDYLEPYTGNMIANELKRLLDIKDAILADDDLDLLIPIYQSTSRHHRTSHTVPPSATKMIIAGLRYDSLEFLEYLETMLDANTFDFIERKIYEKDFESRCSGFRGCNPTISFFGADLEGADLGDANFRSVNCRTAIFTNANLKKANFAWSTCHNADFRYANLENADFRQSHLRLASFEGAKLKKANFHGASAFRTDFRNVSMRGAQMERAVFELANLQGADLVGAGLLGTSFIDANLQDANMSNCDMRNVNFQGAHMQNANLQISGLPAANLIDADLRGANFQSCSLHGANFQGARLDGANFNGATLEGADFAAATYDDTTVWPAGPPVDAEGVEHR
jgi:uncharacterized protein YjbI with pentapeptide repeats